MKVKKIIFSLAIMSCLTIAAYTMYEIFSFDKLGQRTAEIYNLDNGMKDHLFNKDLLIDAKMPAYKDLEELEKTTEMIVIAKKISEEAPTILYGQENRIDIAYTLSHFKVSKVISGDQLKSGNEFTMLENQAYDERQDVTYHIGGYQMIKEGRDYLLLLRKSETDPWYIVAGVNPGKVDLNSDKTDYPEFVRNANTPIAKQIKSEYQDDEKIREEARNEYLKYIE
ncbi:hypothetical protein [Enterococcus phoeniculicola]|uniref:Uncharacterized protein n=1 Tax=Enterococcus phoeniculicola ATCC BAA-412 TaxID=1158610 RepID=R3VYL7_9ENTE|nr:hypothetical protein [Enterococcus phoeniculicola]EOL40587.1 hypothetical protein UC3_03583 [Enterococcus phoeniculicola ATCC BAA-412]EOT79144.1 hypothetical protein I589_00651 [Enterococcus phoeniculicola ATCC BAA-412]